MFDDQQICPYTGLRSFTEEESLYFKGREEDIDQATAQLQKNKFLMLTGASGDGKSSLIYAGIIPNARAGFLKSRYVQWCVADFRPERTPFDNLAKSLSRQLDIGDPGIVSSELSHGFSALVDLYKNSRRFVDTDSIAWHQADEKGHAAIKREAANLIVLVDQFEEFFTNPENYHQGQPSRESNLVLNLLLETARIALEEDLPIYVVFTMRSDYIGQCAAFRGLPEYLGFSQYFVPRLNRKQLQQVIEDPAELSGNRISRRLTERLIHDITEGVDQLPILQHALNQIWLAANDGREEMDLVHYAMVGGMSPDELEEAEAARFTRWFQQLTPEIKACYHEPSLQNVLDTHVNKLYEQAEEYYREKTGKSLSDAESKHVIRTAFTCLTKIDQGRAVRNRMTLQEITDVIGIPSLGTKEVNGILNVFREPGNTFIHPFISADDDATRTLDPGQVLDITHESLIRNWRYLGQWAREEFDSRAVSLDFEQQLGRWVDSGKSKSFLLPIGPLTYFENWFQRVKPNAYWIARYLPDDAEPGVKLSRATEILDNSKAFLNQSAAKHSITRAIMRIGTKRIAAMLGGILILVLSSFAISNYMARKNETVLQSIKADGVKLMASRDASPQARAILGLELYRQGLTNAAELVSTQKDEVGKVNLATTLASQLVLQGYGSPREPLLDFLGLADSIMRSFSFPEKDPVLMQRMLKEINDYRVVLELANVYTADTRIRAWRQENARRAAEWARLILEKQPEGFTQVNEWGPALEHGLNFAQYDQPAVRKMISILSPFEGSAFTPWLSDRFKQDNVMEKGEQGYGFYFNGLYQELAYLYAAEGDHNRALQCIDTLLKYSANNFQGEYASGADNAANIAYVFHRYDHPAALDSFVLGYCARKKTTPVDFYARLTGRMMHERATTAAMDLYWWTNKKMNLNTRYVSRADIGFFFNRYRDAIQLNPDPEFRKFNTALTYKNEGILKSIVASEDPNAVSEINALFDQAMTVFSTVSKAYQDEQIRSVGFSGTDNLAMPRKNLFIYPDLRLDFHPFEPRAFIHFYFTPAFLEYIIDKGRFDVIYADPDDMRVISEWLTNYNVKMFVPSSFLVQPMPLPALKKLHAELTRRDAFTRHDFNILNLELGYRAQLSGDSQAVRAYYGGLMKENFPNILRNKEYANSVNSSSFRMMAYAVKGLAETGAFDEALSIIRVFKKPANRSSLYAFASARIYADKGNTQLADRLLDSARAEAARVKNVQGVQFNREVIAYALCLQDPVGSREEIGKMIKNLPSKARPNSKIAEGFAFHNRLYEAYHANAGLIPDEDLASNLWMILIGKKLANPDNIKSPWQGFDQNELKLFTQSIDYIDESS